MSERAPLPDRSEPRWPVLGSPEDADVTHRWARECLEMWETERARLLTALDDVSVRLDQIERDRRESDKVLLGVHAARMVLTRLTLDEERAS